MYQKQLHRANKTIEKEHPKYLAPFMRKNTYFLKNHFPH